MTVYLALFGLNKSNDCLETVSVHQTKAGAERAIDSHQEYVYENADIFFKGDGQYNLCVWDVKKVNLEP